MSDAHQHDHSHEDEQEICPRMDDNCRGQAKFTLAAVMEGYLQAHGTTIEEEKGNAEARKVLTEMLAELPSAEQIREQNKLYENLPGGVIPEA